MDRRREEYSPALLEAQKRLEHLRSQHGVTGSPHRPVEYPAPLSTHGRIDPPPAAFSSQTSSCSASSPDVTPPSNQLSTVRLYPDLALAMLREEVIAEGRIWLLLRHLDQAGRGWVSLAETRLRLGDDSADLRVCGKRQLRKLLARGEGLFWRKDEERLWIRSTAKVAAALQVRRLTGRPVALPVAELLGGIGHVRAHFYASFHSGRVKTSGDSSRSGLISRSTLKQLSHSSRRSQQRYEKRAGITVRPNIAIGSKSTIENDQHTAWFKGTAAFRLLDSSGKVGQKGVKYSAWQLPNSYSGPHEPLSKGKQKRINRELADLFMKGMTGNGDFSYSFGQDSSRSDGPPDGRCRRLFHGHSRSAAANFAKFPDQDAYWPHLPSSAGFGQVWFIIRRRAIRGRGGG